MTYLLVAVDERLGEESIPEESLVHFGVREIVAVVLECVLQLSRDVHAVSKVEPSVTQESVEHADVPLFILLLKIRLDLCGRAFIFNHLDRCESERSGEGNELVFGHHPDGSLFDASHCSSSCDDDKVWTCENHVRR